MLRHLLERGVVGVGAVPHQTAEIVGVLHLARQTHVGVEKRQHARGMVADVAHDANHSVLVNDAHLGGDAVEAALVDGDEILRVGDAVVDHVGKVIFVVLCHGVG